MASRPTNIPEHVDLDALVDEAITETFPASDPPFFMGYGAEYPVPLEEVVREQRPAHPELPSPLRDVYERADELDPECFSGHLADDAEVTFGNNPPLRGPREVAGFLARFFSTLASMKTRTLRLLKADDVYVFEAEVTYGRRREGDEVPIKGVTLLRVDGGEIDSATVYFDLGPLEEERVPTAR